MHINRFVLLLILILMTVPLAIGEDYSDLSGIWTLGAPGYVSGATADTPLCPSYGAQPGDGGTDLNGPFSMGDPDIDACVIG